MDQSIKDELATELFPQIIKGFAENPELQKLLTNDQKYDVLVAMGLEVEDTEDKTTVKLAGLIVTITKATMSLNIAFDLEVFKRLM